MEHRLRILSGSKILAASLCTRLLTIMKHPGRIFPAGPRRISREENCPETYFGCQSSVADEDSD